MRRAARRKYEEKYSAEKNYEMMMAIYVEAAAAHRREATRSRAKTGLAK